MRPGMGTMTGPAPYNKDLLIEMGFAFETALKTSRIPMRT